MIGADAVSEFRDAIRAAGLSPPATLEPGRFHRFPSEGKTNGNKVGWCKLFDDARGGIFGDFATGAVETWQASQSRPMTLVEREAFRRDVEENRARAEAKRKAEQLEAARMASERWAKASPANPSHPYLRRKGIKPHSVRQEGDALLIPMCDGADLHSLQTVGADGDKRFLAGGRVVGCYFSIGTAGPAVCIAEGFATGASIHEATGLPVAVAFNAGNLEAVARALRRRWPDSQIIVCADDDHETPNNPGRAKANEAARAVAGLVATPTFGESRPEGVTDFNDLAAHCGLEAGRVPGSGVGSD
jgi:putative DNA primase/helicase